MSARARWVAALLLSVSCAPAAPSRDASPAPTGALRAEAPAGSAGPPSSAGPARESDAERALQARLGQALAYVSQVRGLRPTSPVRGRLIGRDEIQKYITSELDEETPPDVLHANEALLYAFGTVPADFDYRANVISLMTSQLLGFYDPKQKVFFVSGNLHGEEADVTLWHELVHALQDQHYDLTHLTDWQPDLGDRQAAVHALAEGDATSAMLDAMLKPRGATALEVPDGLMRADTLLGSAALSAPPVLVRSLLAPYVDGLAFTNYLRRRGGFAAVDAAWRSPPVSTEQLLHPEKFLAGEAPLTVALPPGPAGAGELEPVFHDVLGEQSLRILLEEWLPTRTAVSAAADWGGDRVLVLADRPRERWAVAWHLRFDTAAAGARAFQALARCAPFTDRVTPQALGSEPPPWTGNGSQLCLERHTQGPIALVRRGQDLGVAIGPFVHGARVAQDDPGCAVALPWAKSIASR